MLNNDTDSMYVMPTFGMNNSEQNLSAYAIEQAVVPEHVRENTIDLGYEEAQPSYWNNIPEQKHDTMPQSVIEEAGTQKAPDVAAEMGAMSPEASVHYIGQITRVIPGIRREALTLAA